MIRILFFSMLITSHGLLSQNDLANSDDAGRIALAAVISNDIEELNTSSQLFLKNKLNLISSKYGLGGSSKNERFILTANVQIITKDITSTAPPMHAYTLEVGFFIGDGIDGKLFTSTSKTFKGVGETETKAYKAALKNIRTKDPIFQAFIEEGKSNILKYYNSQCDFILKEAIRKSSTKQYDNAMFDLASVPKVCKECFEKCQDTLVYIFKLKLENECQENISRAKSLIANNNYESVANEISLVTPDMKCYPEVQVMLKKIKDHRCSVSLGKAKGAWTGRNIKSAAEYLSEIPSDASCYNEAMTLANQITKKVNADEKKQWDLAYEKYNRNQQLKEKQINSEIDLEFREQAYKENQGYELQKAQINAAREIGVAYGKNQPKSVTYNYQHWWR